MIQTEYKAEDLRFTWRLLIGIIIVQLIGILCGYLIQFHSIQFVSIWVGGAFGTFVGFWFGIWWHFKKKHRRSKLPYFTLGFTGIVSHFLGVLSILIFLGIIKF